MIRVAWLTDIHLNFLQPEEVDAFLDKVRVRDPDIVLVGGDIGEAPTLTMYLRRIEARLRRPVYFVLGNHDYWYNSVGNVRRNIARLCRRSRRLHWLPSDGVVPLTRRACLIGHGCWGDARSGDFRASRVFLNDFGLIRDLADGIIDGLLEADPAAREVLRERLQRLGDGAAARLGGNLRQALRRYRHVLVLAHVSPFPEGARHEGHMCDSHWRPFFVCRAAGRVLRETMIEHPDRRMTVLCGHTHGSGETAIEDNIRCLTGGAVYGRPELQRILRIA